MATKKKAQHAARKKAAKKKVKKKVRVERKSKRVHLANGLVKGSSEATLLALCKRKIGVTIRQAANRMSIADATVRVTISNLRKKGFDIVNEGGKYRA